MRFTMSFILFAHREKKCFSNMMIKTRLILLKRIRGLAYCRFGHSLFNISFIFKHRFLI